MLLYLYTFEKPNFNDGAAFTQPFRTAKAVYELADKYSIPHLRDAAKDFMLDRIRSWFGAWSKNSDLSKTTLICWIPVLYEWTLEGTEEIRNVLIETLVGSSKCIVEDIRFQELLRKNGDLMVALVRAMATKSKGK